MELQTITMEPYLDAKDIASVLGVKATTVCRMVRRGQLPAVRLSGSRLRFRRTAIEHALQRCEVRPLAFASDGNDEGTDGRRAA